MDSRSVMEKKEDEIMWVEGLAGEEDSKTDHNESFHSLLNDIEVDDDEDPAAVANYALEPIMTAAAELALEATHPDQQGEGKGTEKKGLKNPVSWLLNPVVARWNRALRSRMIKYNRQLVSEYYLQLQTFFGAERVPPEITVVFDAIFEGYQPESAPMLDISDELPMISAESKFYESHATKKLRKLLHITLEVVKDIIDIMSKIQSKLDSEGCLFLGSAAHLLCHRSCEEMASFMKRLEFLSSVLRERVSKRINNEDVQAAAKVVSGTWLVEMEECFSKDISFSLAARLEGLYISVCETLVRFGACLCYYSLSLELNDLELSKLVIIASDLTICVQDLFDNIRAVSTNYDYALEQSYKMDHGKILPNFSRENKLNRHCDNIINVVGEFDERMKTMKLFASQLVHIDPTTNPNEYKRYVEDLTNMNEAMQDYPQLFQTLLNTQSVLIKGLNPNCQVAVDEPTCSQEKSEEKAQTTKPPFQELPSKEVQQPLEFECNEKTDATANDEPLENKDEVFVGVFGAEDDYESLNKSKEDESEEDKMLEQLYSGVVHQLKSALVPVKSKMMVREKEAVTKLYGKVQNEDIPYDEEQDENDNLASNGVSEECLGAEAIPLTKRRTKTYKDDEDGFEEDATTASTAFSNGDFMKELRLKLNVYPLTEDEEDEVTFEASSEKGNDEN